MDDMQTLEDWVGPLLRRIAPSERARLARSIAQQLRRFQQQRVKAQRNPDGTPFAPRKESNLRDKAGRVKRKGQMFQKLRTTRFMTARSNGSTATVGFVGRAARIAKVHQYGLHAKVSKRGPTALYKKRTLLSLTDSEVNILRDALLIHLSLPVTGLT